MVLVNLIDLALLGKQAHWNVSGPRFRSVHLELDEVVEQLLAWQDEVAERIAAQGGSPDGRASTVAAMSTVAPVEFGPLRDTDVVQGFADRLAGLAALISSTFADVQDDLVTQDILVGIVGGLDKDAWLFRAQTV